MRLASIAFLAVAIAGPAGAQISLPIPSGWRTPNESELRYDFPFRNDSSTRYLVVAGDFDGDGVMDVARLLVTTNGRTYGLVVSFGGRPAPEMHLMLERGPVRSLASMGIAEVAPGKHELICRDADAGYDWCRPGEASFLDLKRAGVTRFLDGKSAYIYYLRGKYFHRLWVSD